MNRSDSVVFVSLNISDSNRTVNGTKPKSLLQRKCLSFLLHIKIRKCLYFLAPNDSSVNNIILGIGAVVVILIVLAIVIKLIHKCYKMYKADDTDTKDSGL